ncbi:hypothetical protein [Cerasicoccus fimbriatus]|uniref:hypothetical protein n=1 Tax=Cerasicoccus fimbriatus TaxID=3014554 RepID=UPI0022B384A2|nr:hypothetical protein [Cerasicoccus sp. TK19100]
MSTKNLISTLTLSALTALPILTANAEEIVYEAAFDTMEPGTAVGEPYKTRARGENTAILAMAPKGEASKNWIFVKDVDVNEKVYLVSDISPTESGTLSFRLFYPSASATVGIYLRNSELPKSDNNVVEFKSLETSGNIYVGVNGVRQKLPVSVGGAEFLSFDIEFSATDAGEKVDVFIKDTSGRHLIHSATSEQGNFVDTLMITTDTNTESSEFYVGDIVIKKS